MPTFFYNIYSLVQIILVSTGNRSETEADKCIRFLQVMLNLVYAILIIFHIVISLKETIQLTNNLAATRMAPITHA